MCLGIPGRVVETYDENEMRMGRVDFGGVFKQVCLAHTPDAQPGQFVIVHVGFALQVIDQEEAEFVFKFLEEMNDLGELQVQQEWRGRTPTAGGERPGTVKS
jgi:hydrogenase expression/formation protein HypC